MSKLALHYQYVPDWAKRLPQQWAKLIDPPSENPFAGAKIIGRTYVPDGEANALVMLAEAGAEIWFAKFREQYARARYVEAWEGPNEPPVGTPEQRAALDRFTVRWNDLMHAAGYKTVVLNCSCSWPMHGTAGEFVAAVGGADYLGLHEYSRPTMQTSVGELCLHYRQVVSELKAAGLSKMPVVIVGECGLDDGQRHGWKTFAKTEAAYLEQLRWYATELQQDAYVAAAFVFTAGPSGWDDFEVTQTLAQGVLSLTVAAIPPTPELPPTVTEPTEESIRNVAWNALYPSGGVPYAPQYALPRAAAKRSLAQPLTREVRFTAAGKADDSGPYILQGYDGAPGMILWCRHGEWDKVQALRWQ